MDKVSMVLPLAISYNFIKYNEGIDEHGFYKFFANEYVLAHALNALTGNPDEYESTESEHEEAETLWSCFDEIAESFYDVMSERGYHLECIKGENGDSLYSLGNVARADGYSKSCKGNFYSHFYKFERSAFDVDKDSEEYNGLSDIEKEVFEDVSEQYECSDCEYESIPCVTVIFGKE